jgi:hypothetical protein
VDPAHVYFLALDNVLRARDRSNGNQRWMHPIRRRAVSGPATEGGYVFVAPGAEIAVWTANGKPAGTLPLPADTAVPVTFVVRGDDVSVVAVTGNLSSQWQLTLLGPASDPPLAPVDALPGVALPAEPAPKPSASQGASPSFHSNAMVAGRTSASFFAVPGRVIRFFRDDSTT